MTLKTILLVLLLSKLAAGAPLDLNELRLQLMAKVMNSRDFDLMLNKLSDIEVLDMACAKEMEQQKLPIHCFELKKSLQSQKISSSFQVNFSESDCALRVQALSDHEVIAAQEDYHHLPQSCRQHLLSRLKIVTYKKSGKKIE